MSNFLGSHAINMDAKGRLAIPVRVREELQEVCGGRIVLTASADDDRCLLIYPEQAFEEVRAKVMAIPNTHKKVKRLQRVLVGYATPMELDSAGRVLVPPTLRSYAHLDKKLMLVGQDNKLELWDEGRWFEWLDDDDDAEMPPEMEALSL